jgi:DNA invertase Pin-like site-specific DNA recombinase
MACCPSCRKKLVTSYGEQRSTIAAYVRVSSQQQSFALQHDAIGRAARARREKIGRWYNEKQSGKSLERPELTKLRAAILAGEVTKLYVYRLDRLTRSGIRDTLTLVEELRRAGCELVTLSDGFSIDGPGADVVLSVLAWAAQMERQAIGERIRAARARVEREGKHWGRPRSVGPKEIRQIASLIALVEGGTWSLRRLAREVGLPESSVRRVVRQKGAYKPRPKTPIRKASPSRASKG